MYPPRPKHRIRPAELPKFEAQGRWVVQRKYNGTRTLLHVTPERVVEAWTRHQTRHEQWTMSQDVVQQILSLRLIPGQEYWLDGELLHSKTKTPQYKNRIVLFDVLQAGHYLFGSPNLLGRYEILQQICGFPTKKEPFKGIALAVTDNIWLAETYYSNFVEIWNEYIDLPEIEGLVLKRPDSVLDTFGTRETEVSWQIRCRKEHKNYSF